MVQHRPQNSDRNILISIIIPHFNGEKIIVDCLESLQKSSFQEKEIIVVDNGSTDNTASFNTDGTITATGGANQPMYDNFLTNT